MQTTYNQTVELVKHLGLCTSCGYCESICPVSCIRISENIAGLLVPTVDDKHCIGCGKCMKICPGINQEFPTTEHNEFTGKIINAYKIKATDLELISHGQSGGGVSSFLNYLISSKQIEEVLLTKIPSNKSLRPKVFWGKDSQDIFESQGSVYIPTAPGREMKKIKDAYKLAVVGLPCHLHGLQHFQKEKKIKNDFLKIGLICDGVLNSIVIDYFKDHYAKKTKPDFFRFKSKLNGSFPGDFYFQYQDQKIFILDQKRAEARALFTPPCCCACWDKMNVSADLVFGDAWGCNPNTEHVGIVFTRTEKAENLLNKAQESGLISLQPVNFNDILNGQNLNFGISRWHKAVQYLKEKHIDIINFGKIPRLDNTIFTNDMKSFSKSLDYFFKLARASSKFKKTKLVTIRKIKLETHRTTTVTKLLIKKLLK